MSEILVLGHRNPDTDAVCAPACYAYFKNSIDPENTYTACMCGPPGDQTRYVFERFGRPLPLFVSDIEPRVSDIMETKFASLHPDDPVLRAIRVFDEGNVRTLPVVRNDGTLAGVVSVIELSEFFIPKGFETRPEYVFRPGNLNEVLPGRFLRRGTDEEFKTRLMVGAMSYETFLARLERIVRGAGRDMGRNPILIVGNRPNLLRHAVEHDFPAIILTGTETPEAMGIDFGSFRGWIFASNADTAETIRLLVTAVPVKSIASSSAPTVTPETKTDDVKDLFRKTPFRSLPVLDEPGRLVGMVNSSSLIDIPKRRVILVDHNESAQAVEGIETAEIIEVIDHHRVGMERTIRPIYIYSRPLGSSCTLVYQHFRMHAVPVPPDIAGLLLSGILSDTLSLRSPTVTAEDRRAAEELSGIAGVDHGELGREIFSRASTLSNMDPAQAVTGDLKIYAEHGLSVGIAQVEVTTLSDLGDTEASYRDALHEAARRHRLDWMMLLVTNILDERSILLTTGFAKAERLLVYEKTGPDRYDLPGVLSRKKQLLPEVLRVMEKAAGER